MKLDEILNVLGEPDEEFPYLGKGMQVFLFPHLDLRVQISIGSTKSWSFLGIPIKKASVGSFYLSKLSEPDYEEYFPGKYRGHLR